MSHMEEQMISIIVPIYNVESYLEECLEAIRVQTYQNFEVLLIEDGSTDKSPEICDKFCRMDSRFLVLNGKHRGVSAARNTGLDRAKGKYLVFIDSDDRIEKDMLEYLYKGICSYHTQIAICGIGIIEGNKQRNVAEKSPCILTSEEALTEVCKDGKIKNYLWAQIYERRLFDGIRFPEGRIFEDIAVYYRIIERIDTVVLLNEIKYYYVRRKGSLSFGKNREANIQRCYAYRRRYENLLPEHPGLKRDMQRLIFVNYRKLCKEWGRNRRIFAKQEVQKERRFFVQLEDELKKNKNLTFVECKEVAVLKKYNGGAAIKLWILECIRIFQKVIK